MKGVAVGVDLSVFASAYECLVIRRLLIAQRRVDDLSGLLGRIGRLDDAIFCDEAVERLALQGFARVTDALGLGQSAPLGAGIRTLQSVRGALRFVND
ncbi:hypothetical protein DQ353_12545 [Arthrobacter sp. AQ5-05]|nr:hypothetical protein DQ353_12545 [Arthrobacter sp. AQ5-05]